MEISTSKSTCSSTPMAKPWCIMTTRSAASTKAANHCFGMTSEKLKAVKFKDTSERMMSLGDLCALVDGRVPLVIEVKSHFDGDRNW